MSQSSSVQEIQDYDSNAGFDSDQDIGSDTEMGIDFQDDDDDQDQFDAAFPNSQSQADNKAPTYSYKCLKLADVVRTRKEIIDDVAALLGVKESEADLLLRQYNWKRDRLTDDYLEDSDKVMTKSGIPTVKIPMKIQLLPDFECQVCFSTSADVGSGRRPKMPTFSLSCGHRFCSDCYKSYLDSKIGDSELNISCIDEGCRLKVEEDGLKLLIDGDMFDRYKRLLLLSFVSNGLKDVKWCTGPDCPNAVKCDVSLSSLDVLVPEVECDCKHTFCFGCGDESHKPAICALVKKWEKKMRDDSETAKWLQSNTKDCPGKGCGKSIEKNGGCQHMTCRECRYEWCWTCQGDWKEHKDNYKCNRFVPPDEAREDSRVSLARYLHYFDRYNNHDQSAKLAQEFYENSEEKMTSIQETSGLKWIETRYIERGVKTVIECRKTLKWSYCFAFYLDKGDKAKVGEVVNHQAELFEDNQRDLERAVEDLNHALERPIEIETIPTLRTEITNLSNYVSTRRKIILEDAAQGLYEGRLKWVERA